METENRRFTRIEIDEPIGVQVGEHYRVEKGRQFSEGGLLFESERAFAQGQMITMTFQISGTVLIPVVGQIAYIAKSHSGKTLIGVRFVGSANYAKILLNYFMHRRSY